MEEKIEPKDKYEKIQNIIKIVNHLEEVIKYLKGLNHERKSH